MRGRSERNWLFSSVKDGTLQVDWLSDQQPTAEELIDWERRFRSTPSFIQTPGVPSVIRTTKHFLECCMFGGIDLDEIEPIMGLGMWLVISGLVAHLCVGPRLEPGCELLHIGAMLFGVICTVPCVYLGLALSLPSVVRPKWELVRFCRMAQAVVIYRVLQGVGASSAVETTYSWSQLIPLLPPLARPRDPWQLEILVMDGNVPVDIIRVGLGVRSSGTAAGQWEYIRRYMTEGTENLPKVKKLSWYLTPWQCADRCSFHWERELEPHGSPESLWLWHGLRKFAIGFWLYLIELLRWQPIWSKSTLIMCGETPWIFYTKAVLQTLAGWATVATLTWSTWWLAETYGVVAWVLNGWYGLLEGR